MRVTLLLPFSKDENSIAQSFLFWFIKKGKSVEWTEKTNKLVPLDLVKTKAEGITNIISKISDASEDEARSIVQLSSGLDQISSVVQSNTATAEQSAAASEELSGQANVLQDLVSKFQLKNEE